MASAGDGGEAGHVIDEELEWIRGTEFGKWLEEQQEAFDAALKQNDLTIEDNPRTEPFKSKYAARKVFQKISDDVSQRMASDLADVLFTEITGGDAATATDDESTDKENGEDAREADASSKGGDKDGEKGKMKEFMDGTLGMLGLYLGSNHIEAEETSEGERHLKDAARVLHTTRLQPRNCTVYIKVTCMQGILWAGRGDHKKSLEFLKEAEDVYTSYKSTSAELGPPGHPNKLLPAGTTAELWQQFEAAHTHTLFYLAQCYGHLGQPSKSAEHCQLTLRRQLEAKSYTPLDWAINAAGISQYYLGMSEWTASAHCLVCASHVALEQPGETDEQKEQHANIDRCWLKYYVNLLDSAVEPSEQDAAPSTLDRKVNFAAIDVSAAQAKVPVKLPTSYAEALVAFRAGQEHAKVTLAFYNLDDHVSDYVVVLQDQSKLYQKLSEFAKDPQDKCKLHKRRVDLLSAVEKELNPQYFLATNRQLQYEVAETLHEMMNLKRSRFLDGALPDEKQAGKINKLGQQSLNWYNKFIDTLRDNKTKEIPETLEEHVVRPYLRAKFSMASIYHRFMVGTPGQYAEFNEKSVAIYHECINYCAANPDYDGFQEELAVSKDMAEMIPIKISRMLQGQSA